MAPRFTKPQIEEAESPNILPGDSLCFVCGRGATRHALLSREDAQAAGVKPQVVPLCKQHALTPGQRMLDYR